jgi:hypothetical protein
LRIAPAARTSIAVARSSRRFRTYPLYPETSCRRADPSGCYLGCQPTCAPRRSSWSVSGFCEMNTLHPEHQLLHPRHQQRCPDRPKRLGDRDRIRVGMRSGTVEPSHVLRVMGVEGDLPQSEAARLHMSTTPAAPRSTLRAAHPTRTHAQRAARGVRAARQGRPTRESPRARPRVAQRL